MKGVCQLSFQLFGRLIKPLQREQQLVANKWCLKYFRRLIELRKLFSKFCRRAFKGCLLVKRVMFQKLRPNVSSVVERKNWIKVSKAIDICLRYSH